MCSSKDERATEQAGYHNRQAKSVSRGPAEVAWVDEATARAERAAVVDRRKACPGGTGVA